METASEATVRGYEVVAGLLFAFACWYLWRRRSALYAGVFLATSIGGGLFEWVYDSKFYFRLTTSEHFLPAWSMDGVEAPLAMILFYAFFFGIPLVIALDHHEWLVEKFGPRGLYVFFALLGAVGTPMFECVNTSVTGIYTYHQEERFLLWGMPYSNIWFGALIFCFSYWGMVRVRALTEGETGTTQLLAGFAAVVTAFFVATALNGVWYAIAQPWTDTPRPF